MSLHYASSREAIEHLGRIEDLSSNSFGDLGPNPWAHPETLSPEKREVYDEVNMQARMAGREAEGRRGERQAAEDEREIGRMADAWVFWQGYWGR